MQDFQRSLEALNLLRVAWLIKETSRMGSFGIGLVDLCGILALVRSKEENTLRPGVSNSNEDG
jgi:hypothetical protein